MIYTVETTFHVNYNELDRAINEYYGWGTLYECADFEGWDNGTSHQIDITCDYDWWIEKAKKIIAELKGPKPGIVWALLWNMAQNGKIPIGKYVIKVSW